MALTPEEEAELQELQSLVSQLPDDPTVDDTHFDSVIGQMSPQGKAYSAVERLSGPEGIPQAERDSLLADYHSYSDPIDQARAIDTAKGIGTTALEVGGSLLMPQAKIAQSLPFLTRAAGYAGTALSGAVGLEGGKKVAQFTGLEEPTTFSQDVESLGANTALGVGVPVALDAASSGLKSAASWFSKKLFNTPGRVAGFMGASSADLNKEAEKYVTGRVEELMSNSPFFNEQVVKRASPGKQYDAASTYKNQLGREIRSFYETHAPIPVSTDLILSHPKVVELQKIAKDPYTLPDIRTEAAEALKGLEVLTAKPAHALSDVWGLRQQLDDSIEAALYNAGPRQTPKYAEFVKDTADAVRQAIELSVGSGVRAGTITADAADALLKAKQEFSNLAPVVKLLGGAAGKASKHTIIDKVGLPGLGAIGIGSVNPAVGAGIGGLLALKSGPGRAFMASAPDILGQGSALAAQISPYMGAGSALFRRTTDSSELDVPAFTQTVFQKAASLMGPETAQALATQVEETMTGGNEMAKRQMIGILGQQFPEIFEPHKDGLMSVVDNRIQDPFEKDMHLMSASELDNPVDRARVIGALYDGGKYAPLDKTPPPAPMVEESSNFGLDTIYNNLTGSYEVSPELNTQLSQLEKATAVHSQDFP